MKTKRILALMFAVGATAVLAACGAPAAPFTAKPADGIAPAFDDGASVYSIAPSVMQTDGNTRYVYYTANLTADKADSAVVVRKGTLKNGKWTYGDRKTVLSPSGEGWDAAAVGDPSVIKGNFGYKGSQYSYLLAYEGRETEGERNRSVGFAVSNSPDGGFTRVKESVLAYDYTLDGDAYGYGAPSLVSHDKGAKFTLYYTDGDASGVSEYFAELDGTDLASLDFSAWQALPVQGLKEIDPNAAPTFREADFAAKDGKLYAVRSKYPLGDSPALPKEVQIAEIGADELYSAAKDVAWTLLSEGISSFDLSDGEKTGWERIYSPAFVRDEYGALYGETTVFLTVTAFDAEGNYLHNQTIVEYRPETV